MLKASLCRHCSRVFHKNDSPGTSEIHKYLLESEFNKFFTWHVNFSTCSGSKWNILGLTLHHSYTDSADGNSTNNESLPSASSSTQISSWCWIYFKPTKYPQTVLVPYFLKADLESRLLLYDTLEYALCTHTLAHTIVHAAPLYITFM